MSKRPALRLRRALPRLLFLWGALLGGCGPSTPTNPPPSSPPPDASRMVVPTGASGATEISFVTANIAPGSTLSGCGQQAAGCAGRLTMTFRLRSAVGGPVLRLSAFLHGTNLIACLLTASGPFVLRAGEPFVVEVPFDRADRCATPIKLATLDAVVEGTSAVAARQEWTLSYVLAP